tara:strand:- start:536 stop:742 length:207 start_codon:yes stop_codon:yes gene_type:complete
MYDLSMDEELDKFFKDRNRFKNLKKLVDFNFEVEDFEGKDINVSKPKYKKKLKTSVFIKNNNRNKSLF